MAENYTAPSTPIPGVSVVKVDDTTLIFFSQAFLDAAILSLAIVAAAAALLAGLVILVGQVEITVVLLLVAFLSAVTMALLIWFNTGGVLGMVISLFPTPPYIIVQR